MRANPAAAMAIVAVAMCANDAGAADESAIVLAEGPERARVQSACSMCHSLDYIVMNSPIQDATGWDKTVKKMTTVYGAPLTPEESAAIVAYLARHYGTAP